MKYHHGVLEFPAEVLGERTDDSSVDPKCWPSLWENVSREEFGMDPLRLRALYNHSWLA